MRKWLAILLISLLSLQASWAAAASYCAHEQGAAARHFGHHEHQHALEAATDGVGTAAGASATNADSNADSNAGTIAKTHAGLTAGAAVDTIAADTAAGNPDAGTATDATPLAGVDLDCSVCHAHALSGMPSAPFIAAMDSPPQTGAAAVPAPLLSVLLPRPDRPNWLAA